MANLTLLDPAANADSPQPQTSSYIYLALYEYLSDAAIQDIAARRLSWRLIPSESATAPTEKHELFGIHHDEDSIVTDGSGLVDDPMDSIRAFIRLPVQTPKSFNDVVNQIQAISDNYIEDAMDDGWQEWEWVYNVFETLEVLEYLDDRVTNTWQYINKPKMEIFKEKILNLAKQVYDMDGPPEARVIDFPLDS